MGFQQYVVVAKSTRHSVLKSYVDTLVYMSRPRPHIHMYISEV